MRKIYFSTYLIIFLSLFITSCNQEQEDVMIESDKKAVELDYFDNDGSMSLEEELAPMVQTKSYCYYYNDYSLLRPTNLTQTKVNELKCGETKTLPLLVGSSKKKVGVIKVSNDDDNLYITVKANSYKYMKKVYFYIGDKQDIPFYSNGYPNVRKFNYKAFPYYYGGQKKATYRIPLSSIDSDCFEVVAYSKVYDNYTGCYYSAFGYDRSLTQEYYYSYYSGCYYFKDWVRSFEYCKQDCDTSDCLYLFGRKNHEGFYSCINVNVNGEVFAGWSNGIPYKLFNSEDNFNLDFMRHTNGCDVSNAIRIGRVEVTADKANPTSLNFVYYMYDIEFDGPVVDSPNPYDKISEVNLYVGPEENPYNEDGTLKSNINDSHFYSEKFDTPISRTNTIVMPWNDNTNPNTKVYIIPYAKVCNTEE